MAKTKIQWTDEVWNPVTGCTKVSQGCKNCYAERMATRLAGRAGYPAAPHQFDVTLHPDKLDDPLRWKKPRRVFVNSMSDLFHKDVPEKFIWDVFEIMHLSYWHTFQVLTKRPERMQDFISHYFGEGRQRRLPLSNVWLGVSVEDQKTANERLPWLIKTSAAVRFISYEPALASVKFAHLEYAAKNHFKSLIDWIICGGESGPGARPMHPDWARSARDQCQEAGVPFFFKQWGEWMPICPQYPEGDNDNNTLDELDLTSHSINLGNKGTIFHEDYGLEEYYWCGYQPDPNENPWFLECVGKKNAGRLLDGREWNEYPLDTAGGEL